MGKAWMIAGAVWLAVAGPVVAAKSQPAVPTAAELRPYHFDLARNFFTTPAQEVAERAVVVAAISELNQRAYEATTPAGLAVAMAADDRAQRLFRKHDLYFFLRFAVDMREEAGMAAADEMRATLRAARNRLKEVVLANADALFGAAAARQTGIEHYRFWFNQAKREADHRLSAEQQQVVDSLEPLIGGSHYPRLVRELKFKPVIVGGKSLDPLRDQSQIESDASAAVRRSGSRQLIDGYATKRDQLAELLIRVAKGSDALARLRKHGGAVEQAAFESFITPVQYRAMLAEVARNSATFKAWQRRVQDPFSRPSYWSPTEAAKLIAQSAEAVAPIYAAEFAALLDPGNGRADLAGNGQRVPLQGAASVYPIGVSAIYMQKYQGDLLDLVILAHESGHAVQAQFMYRAGVPMAYAAGPGYFTESFGRFQELVTLDRLYRSTTEPKRRSWLRDALAARLLSVFNSAEEAAVELAIHDAVRGGTARTADDLDRVTATASAAYTSRIVEKPEMRGLWMLSGGYFQMPFQELNDAFASLLAVRYYQLYRQDPTDFGPAYMALLSGGYSDEPRTLLRRNLGIDIAAAEFVPATLAALKLETEALYP